jgi:NADPH:quinone reductase-like Zn-dependent oxidoreductase
MKAFVKTRYGGPEVLHLEETDKPFPQSNHILVKVAANSVNPADWHIIRGKPLVARFAFGLLKPKDKIAGGDFSGTVEETGSKATRFKPGDRVFGASYMGGAFAGYVSVPESSCTIMPGETEFHEMACVPVAGVTALQALTSHGKLKEGETVLVNGASGGVGHFTVQMAKAFGGRVTGVCSSGNAEFVKALGAGEVIPYDKVNIHRHNQKYDLVVDVHGNLTYGDFRRMGKRGVELGFTSMGHIISLMGKTAFGKFPLVQFTAKITTEDLEVVASLIKNGQVKVVIDKTFPFSETPEAVRYIETMRAKGKVAIISEP